MIQTSSFETNRNNILLKWPSAVEGLGIQGRRRPIEPFLTCKSRNACWYPRKSKALSFLSAVNSMSNTSLSISAVSASTLFRFKHLPSTVGKSKQMYLTLGTTSKLRYFGCLGSRKGARSQEYRPCSCFSRADSLRTLIAFSLVCKTALRQDLGECRHLHCWESMKIS